MKNSPKIRDIGQHLTQLPAIANVEKIAVPNTSIQGRAPIYDLSKIPSPHMGIERVWLGGANIFPRLERVENESHSSDQPIYKFLDDHLDRIRLIGTPFYTTNNNGWYTLDTAFLEITFYGTGINFLTRTRASAGEFTVEVDGVSKPNVSFGSGSEILQDSGAIAAHNCVYNLISGLTEGVHTIKIGRTSGAAFSIYAVDIINESTSLSIPAGSVLSKGSLFKGAAQSISYNSGWTNQYGTAGTKGGHVLVYMDEQGLVKKDIQWTDVSQGNLASADHSNEEVIRKVNVFEFKYGANDFASIPNTSPTDRASTLDDGTTTLVGSNVGRSSGNGIFLTSGAGHYIVLTFVGTGLDIIEGFNAAITVDMEISVDGSVIDSSYLFSGVSGNTVSIVSGLPYGTHTVKINTVGTSGGTPAFSDFIIYGPKKPELPKDCAKLGSYYLMADNSQNLDTTNGAISQGRIRKYSVREMIYSGSAWSIRSSVDPAIMGGYNLLQ